MALPANEDTRANANNYIGFEPPNNHIPWTNDTGGDLAKGDVVIVGPYVGILDCDIAADETGTINIADGAVVDSQQVAAGSTFATRNIEVWYNPTTGEYQDTSDNNLYGVGAVLAVLNANGTFAYLKRRYWVREAFYAET
jgi:predicted RecA/RadA family phage recombinase